MTTATTTAARHAGLARVTAVINGKGGTFKSSVVSSIGALVAEAGWNVLLIDFDPQGNLSEDLGLGEETDDGEQQFEAVPKGAAFRPQPTGRPRLDIIHGGQLLHDLHAVMQARQNRDPDGWSHALANSIAGVADDYDLILIDCPPGNEVLQTLALVASRYALIPTRSDASSRKGLREVARRFQSVRPHNPDLELLGVVRTGITSSGKAIRDEVRRDIEIDLGGAAPVLQTCIRYAERPAKTVRDTGRLPHELEPDLAQQRQQLFSRLRELRKTKNDKAGKHRHDPSAEAEIHLAPSTSGLAQDYAELTQEFLDLLSHAETAAEATA
jgi:chromosome partitioning protein